MGDLNLDFLKWNRPDQNVKNMSERTKNWIETIGFNQYIQWHTRTWRNQEPSLLDQVWSNKPECIMSTRNIVNALSDHNIIETTIRVKGREGVCQEYEKRSRKNFSPEKFRSKLDQVDWTPLYLDNNPSTAYHFLETKILEALNELAPIIKVQPKSHHKKWISQETRQLMEQRNAAREVARGSNLDEDWAQFRQLRNVCSNKTK